MSKNMTLDFVALLRAWSIEDPALLRLARLLLLDGLAVSLAGSAQPGPSLAGALARKQGGNQTATVIGQGFSTSPSQAAQINGMSMHVLDYEPMWNPPNHALSTMLPGLLALAEQQEASGAGPQGERLLCALTKFAPARCRGSLSMCHRMRGVFRFASSTTCRGAWYCSITCRWRTGQRRLNDQGASLWGRLPQRA